MRPVLYLSSLKTVRPSFEKPQEDAIRWLAEAHSAGEAFAGFPAGRSDSSPEYFQKLISRFGCSPERIASRGHELADFTHTRWDEMRIFRLREHPGGLPMEARQRVFDELVRAKCENLFLPEESTGSDLIHVSCTGYLSPSPLQRFVVERGAAAKTRVLHAYHMGCYAALPASRMAAALALQQSLEGRVQNSASGVDVVHTELCSLHFNPVDHSPEQLVVQSLFADGFVRYRLTANEPGEGGSLRVLAMNEVQIPSSAHAMTWLPVGWGMAMTLSRDVSSLISDSLKDYIDGLFEIAGLSAAEVLPGLVYAVHPGGPKIIDHIQSLLEIPNEKIQASKNILRKYGNMSSATLPHVWHEILADDIKYPNGTRVLSLAFGPGLTIAGSLFEVVR